MSLIINVRCEQSFVILVQVNIFIQTLVDGHENLKTIEHASVLTSLFQRGGPPRCESGPLRCTAGRHAVFWTVWRVKIVQFYI